MFDGQPKMDSLCIMTFVSLSLSGFVHYVR